MKSKRTSIVKETLQLYLQTSWRHKPHAIRAFGNPIGAALTMVGVPFFASKALNSIAMGDGQFTHHMTILIIIAIVGIMFNRLGFINLLVLQAKTMDALQSLVFRRLMQRSVSFHTDQISGKLVSDAIDFVNSYGTLVNSLFNLGISFISMLLFGLVAVSVSSWQLGLFLIITTAITLAWTYNESRVRSSLRAVRLKATKDVTAHLSDTIVNAPTVKTFAAEQREITNNNRLSRILRDLRIDDWSRAGYSGSHRMGFLLGVLVLLLLLVHYLAGKNPAIMSTGLFAFTYTLLLLIRLFDINTLARQVEESLLQATPIVAMLQEEVEVVDASDARPLSIPEGKIVFDQVRFAYEDTQSEQTVFENLSITIQPGEKVGLVGPSGGGKSTLTKLLLRFADIDSGMIAIDGQDIACVTQQSLREHIGYVPQEALLFHRTIKENLLYGKPDANNEELHRAAKLAYADEFIASLPNGYDTVVGERGVKLSGGQRQRIVIARAILKNAPILVLDEATSALDSESEKLIQAAFDTLTKDKTTIVIAHRLSTIQQMDRIIVLDEGKVVEQGSHKALLRKKGLYARLWAHQSGGFLIDDED